MLNRRSLLATSLLLPARQAMANAKHITQPRWPSALVMGTGRPGGAYTVYGPAWGALAQRASGVSFAYMASGGAATDILLIEQGTAQLGMTTVTIADQARNGTGTWTAGVKLDSFRALFPIFPSILQTVAVAASGITALPQLSNRRIGVGPDGGSGSAAVPALLGGLAITPSSCVTGDYIPQIQQMLAGDLDACAFIGAPPMSAIQAAAMQHRLQMIGFTPEEITQVVSLAPGWTAMTLPAGMFPGQSTPIASIGTANFAIGAACLPDTLVRVLTMTAMRNRDRLALVVPAVASAPAATLVGQGKIPFHPGAALALRQLGIDVPAKFIES